MLSFIKTENAFNKLLRRGTKQEEDVSFLFVSPYDKYCNDLIKEIASGNHKLPSKLHVVDSFETPHAFVACSTNKVPCLVEIKSRKKQIEYYLPFIYERLGGSLH